MDNNTVREINRILFITFYSNKRLYLALFQRWRQPGEKSRNLYTHGMLDVVTGIKYRHDIWQKKTTMMEASGYYMAQTIIWRFISCFNTAHHCKRLMDEQTIQDRRTDRQNHRSITAFARPNGKGIGRFIHVIKLCHSNELELDLLI